MQLKKTIKKVIALGTGAAMVGATIMGAMAADLSAYPAPFITDGKFDGVIVVGDTAAASDVIGAVDIATSLQFNAKTSSVISTGGGVSLEGDSWKVGTSSIFLEMANSDNASGSIIGENVRDIMTFIGKEELGALADGKFSTNEGEYAYSQYLYFDEANDAQNELVKYVENEDDESADFFFVKSGSQIGKYKLEFGSPAESDVTTSAGVASTTGDTLDDFKNKVITLMGREYSIVQATRPSSDLRYSVKLLLMGGAVTDTILEGETKTYPLDGKDYEVELVFNDGDNVKFKVDGQMTSQLQEGGTFVLSDKKELGVSEILYQGYAGGIHSATFFLGADKVELRDDNITESTDLSSNELVVGSETIDSADVLIDGTDDNSKLKINSIILNMTAEDDFFVPADGKLSEAIEAAGEEKEILFAGTWDMEYKGLSEQENHDIKIATSTDRKYKLVWYDGDGNKVNMPLAYAATDTTVKLSEDSSDKHLIIKEGVNASKKDFLVLTGGTASAGTAKSYLIQYKGSDDSDKDSPKIKFKNIGSGEDLVFAVASSNPVATIKLGGYSFRVDSQGADVSDDFKIKVSLDGEAAVGTDQVNIVDYYGAEITIANATVTRGTAMTDFVVSINTPNTNDYDDKAPAEINFTIGATTTTEVNADKLTIGPENNPLVTPEGEENIAYGYTSMGGMITYTSPSSSPNELTYNYPKEQRLPQLFVTSGATTEAAGSDQVTTTSVVKIDVGAAQLASAVAGEELNHNILLVGGPCANSAAAVIMGSPADCTEGFMEGKAKIKLYEHDNGKVALLVAGYSADDTRRAARVLANNDLYSLSGSELEVTGTSMSDISVSKPAAPIVAPVVDEPVVAPVVDEPVVQ